MANIFHRTPEGTALSTGPSQRQRRAGELLRKAIAEIFQRWDAWSEVFPSSLVTLTRVQLSADLRHATIFVAPLPSKEDSQHFHKTLNKITPALQKRLAGKVSLKFLPVLSFKLDTELDEAARLESLFQAPKVKQDLE